MIADLFESKYKVPWGNFRLEVETEIQGSKEWTHPEFWRIAYDKARIKDVGNTNSLVEFETEEDAAIFILKWT